MKDTALCRGCRNDFYNGHNPLGVKKCWSLDDATEVVRYEIHSQCPPTRPGAFTRRTVYDCYHADDFRYFKKDDLPDCATEIRQGS